jgi:plasmid stabilization system protein ParE
MKLEFHPEAELELIEAATHYDLQVLGLGERFEAEVRRAIDLLLQYPEMGTPADPVGKSGQDGSKGAAQRAVDKCS